jgi:hypothetical protein
LCISRFDHQPCDIGFGRVVLIQAFGHNRWSDIDPISILDYEGIELTFGDASSDIAQGSNT